MDTLIDTLQQRIPKIEALGHAADLGSLREHTLSVVQHITGRPLLKYSREAQSLIQVSAQIQELEMHSTKSQDKFFKAKQQVLGILNTLLDLED